MREARMVGYHKRNPSVFFSRSFCIYRHFNSDGHRGLEDMQIQLIDHVKGEKELRERENHWIYKLATLAPHGLNDNDGFYAQNKKSRAGARAR